MRARGVRPSARPGLVHDQHGCRAVGDLRRRARGVDATVDDRLQCRKGFRRRVPQSLIPADVEDVAGEFALASAFGCFEGEDFTVEASLVPRLACPLLAAHTEFVDVGAGDATSLRDPLGGRELIGHLHLPRRGVVGPGFGADVGAERGLRHHLDPAGDADLDGVGGDESRDQMVGLLCGPALAVDGGRAGGLGEPGRQPCLARDVAGLRARLGDAPADDLFDEGGVDTGLLDQSALGDAQQFLGVQARQPPCALADRRPGRFDDYRHTHVRFLSIHFVTSQN